MRVGSGKVRLMAVLAACAGVAAYFLLPHGAPQAEVRTSPARAAVPAPAAPQVPGPVADTSPAAAPVTAPLAPDETALCGHGRMKFDAADQVREKASSHADKVLDRVKASLAASKRPRDVALGLYMQQSTDPLVAMAVSQQGDPQVLGLAFLACGYGNAGSCARLSPQHWAHAEPDNGVPWMLIASGAGADKEARNAAVVRASNARYFEQHAPDFLAMLQWPALRDQPPQTYASLQDQMIGLQTSLPTLLYMPLIQYCSDPALDRSTQREVCGNLSTTLLNDRTLFGFSTGIKLAELAGAPREQIAALREKRAALHTALNSAATRRWQRSSSECDDVAAMARFAADYSRLGETGLANRLMDEARLEADAAKPRR